MTIVILLLIAWYWINRIYRKYRCRKHGHVWILRKSGKLQCSCCGRKSRLMSIVKPEARSIR